MLRCHEHVAHLNVANLACTCLVWEPVSDSSAASGVLEGAKPCGSAISRSGSALGVSAKIKLLHHQRCCHFYMEQSRCRCEVCLRAKSYGQVSHRKERPGIHKILKFLE